MKNDVKKKCPACGAEVYSIYINGKEINSVINTVRTPGGAKNNFLSHNCKVEDIVEEPKKKDESKE